MNELRTMGDLISRSDMLNRLNDMFKAADVLPVKAYSNAFRLAIVAAETAPAVDAEPVRNGKWGDGRITGYKGLHSVVYTMPCSECGYESGSRTRYYPNCGARMDGDKYATD